MTRTTIRHVADAAGVSIQTVSNVLNGHPSILPATRERVLQSVRDLDYHPNQAARALRQARVTTLASAFYSHRRDEVGDPYRNLIQAALIAEATANGYSLSTTFLDQPPSFDIFRQNFLQRQFGGAVLVGTFTAEQVRSVLDWQMPMVLLEHLLPAIACTSITADYAGGIRQLVAHHVSRGRRRLALLIPPSDLSYTAQERQRGYLQAMADQGLTPEVVSGDWSFESGERAVHALWEQPDRPDALLAGNDRMAVGALRAALTLGLRVPDDIAISGFDDFEFAHYATPGLTTVQVPYERMARQALSLVRVQVETPDQYTPQHILQPVRLIVRESA